MSSFTVTSAGQKVPLDAAGTGEAAFTVTNITAVPVRGRVVATPQPPAAPDWLNVDGAPIRDFAPGAAEQVAVRVAAPPGTPPGSYAFRLDAVSEANPDEDFAQGPSVSFEVPEAKPGKPFPWWILAVAAVVIVGLGVAAFLIFGGEDDTDPPPTPTPTQTATPGIEPVTFEAEQLEAVDGSDLSVLGPQANCCNVTWSGDQQLFFRPGQPGFFTVRFSVPRAGTYTLEAVMTKARDYGVVRLAVDGEPLDRAFDGFQPEGVSKQEVSFGALRLSEGDHRLTVRVTGRNGASVGFFAGIDTLSLLPGRRLGRGIVGSVEDRQELRSDP